MASDLQTSRISEIKYLLIQVFLFKPNHVIDCYVPFHLWVKIDQNDYFGSVNCRFKVARDSDALLNLPFPKF